LETALYLPVKAFLESLGYCVKGEIGGCDIVALKGEEPPVVVIAELKLSFSLELLLQGIDRSACCDEVWLAAKLSPTGRGRERDSRFRALCRRVGFGLLGVGPDGSVAILAQPTGASPRADRKRRSRLVEEHRRRQGDPAVGGGSRVPVMTAYRQRALRCAAQLGGAPAPPRALKASAPDAAAILRRNVYGWFERLRPGLYGLTEAGRAALVRWPVEARRPETPSAAEQDGAAAPR
jgi:hypothetical protein